MHVMQGLECIHVWHAVNHSMHVMQGKYLSMKYFVRLSVFMAVDMSVPFLYIMYTWTVHVYLYIYVCYPLWVWVSE